MSIKSPLPTATYRLQLNSDFTFKAVTNISDYLHQLNISHLYLSPIFESSKSSNHGYDTTDFTKISEERGGRDGFVSLTEKAGSYDPPLKMLLDIVPNHMSASTENPYWRNILTEGSKSLYWSMFDIKVRKSEKIEIPVLSDDSAKEIKIIQKDNSYVLKYYENEYPLSEESLSLLQKNPHADVSDILDMQHYELVPWTDAFHSVSYRRFFDVIGLIGLKIENENIHDTVHGTILKILAEFPIIDGVRVDHIDGLADPKKYLERLSKTIPLVWIEKILGRTEDLPTEWTNQGTTGYEFIDRVNQLMVHKNNSKIIEDFWRQTTEPSWQDFETCVFFSKKQVLNDLFRPELERLIKFVAPDEAQYEEAEIFWTGLLCGLPVYRIYPENKLGENKWIEEAVKTAEKYLGEKFKSTVGKFLPSLSAPNTEHEIKAAKEWQQLSGPVMAKGLEDTAHYRFTPLTALNDVGCTPVINLDEKGHYFDWLIKRARDWPYIFNATSTHDTKRSEDTRNRLYALADYPQEWMDFFTMAQKTNSSFKTEDVPSAATEYFLYQTILATWPLTGRPHADYPERIKNYMQKANREARMATNWSKPDEQYEQKISAFVDNILGHSSFIRAIEKFAEPLARAGAINSLAVLMLKIIAPGIPDIYQGSEIWDFSLVDPDNRRAVDYDLRQRLLVETDDKEKNSGRENLIGYLSTSWKTGAIKLWLTRELLKIRGQFFIGVSSPDINLVETEGSYSENLIAYTLSCKESKKGLLVLCQRYPGLIPVADGLGSNWADTKILSKELSNARDFTDLLRQKKIAGITKVSEILADFPVAIVSFTIE